MREWLRLERIDWAVTEPWAIWLMAMIGLDILMGLTVAFIAKKVSSTVSWNGMAKKAGTVILVAMAVVMDPLIPLQLGVYVCVFFMATEGISLLEKAKRLGLKVPSVLSDSLIKTRDNPESGGATPKETK